MTVYTIRNKNIEDLSFIKDNTFVYDAELHQGFIVNNMPLLIHKGSALTYDELAYGVFRNDIISVTPDKIAKVIFKKDFFLTPSMTITENLPIGSVVGVLVRQIDIETYSYTVENYTDVFEIVGNELRTKSIIDYEARMNYVVQIKISDNYDTTRFWVENINIDVINTADTLTFTSYSVHNIVENSPIGTVLCNINSLFTAEFGLHTALQLLTFNDKFAINGNGELVVNGALDYEVKTSYDLQIKITDISNVLRFWTMTLIVNIDNLNDSLIFSPSRVFNVPENTPYNAIIGDLSTLLTAAMPVRYELLSYYELVRIVGTNLVVNGPSYFDYEYTNKYIVTVRVYSTTSPDYWDMDVTINITNVPDTLTMIQYSPYTIVENLPIDTIIANLAPLITKESGLNVSMALIDNTDKFYITGTSLRIKKLLDYEALGAYERDMYVNIRITNTANPSMTWVLVVYVSITNVPDSILLNASRTTSVSETAVVGTNIVNLDSFFTRETGLLTTYSIVGTTPFKVSGNQLQTNATLNSATNPLYNITVRITNSQNTSMFWDMTVAVTVYRPANTYGTMPVPFNTLWWCDGYNQPTTQYLPTKTFKQLAGGVYVIGSDDKLYGLDGYRIGTNTWKYIGMRYYDGLTGIATNGTLWTDGLTTQLGTATDWKFTSTHYNTHYMIKNDGSLWCNTGRGNTVGSIVRVGVANNWTHICATHSLGIGIKSDGTMWATNYYGHAEVKVASTADWVYVTGSHAYYIGIKADGSAWVTYSWPDTICTWTKIGGGFNTNCNIADSGYYKSTIIKGDGSLWYHQRGADGDIARIGTQSGYTQTSTSYDGSSGLVGKL